MGFIYDAFVNTAKAKELGVDLSKISSPYGLWNTGLPEDTYFIFRIPEETRERKKALEW